jgi:hypothetical protein
VPQGEIGNLRVKGDSNMAYYWEAAVVGHEDTDGLVKPKAFVVLKDGHAATPGLEDELKHFVKGQARALQVPALDRVRSRTSEDGDRQDPALQAALILSHGPPRPGDFRACRVTAPAWPAARKISIGV